ncbi:VWA domain-containing protein [Micromonospora deserti]|uniref:VWA domain-containing protein n=1 Tax=Micromonospora deserti TaxID=2070366 RepID=A0A2W2ECK4_9ACTN|nr:VWA domain-containing protein [Micromonospora deserti]PZG02554.1 VWA domain-containing protein [Micromonospora deserti]
MLTVPGRHRYRRRSSRGSSVAAAVAVIVVLSGVAFGLRQMAAAGCATETALTVAAAPEVAPAVRSTVAALEHGGGGGACVRVSVNAVSPVDVAAVISARHGANLAGVGRANGATPDPDVWIPDSSIWLSRLTSAAPAFVPSDGTSIASSPVVVAAPEPVAARLGWTDTQLTWRSLLSQVTSGVGVNAGIVEPTRDVAGLSALLALTTATGSAEPQLTTAALRTLAIGRSEVREDLTARFPRASDPTTLATAVGLAVLSEQDVIAYNAAKPPVPLVAVQVRPAPVPLDYPFAVMPGLDPARVAAAETVHRALDAPAFRNLLGPLGLRLPDGAAGPGFTTPRGAPTDGHGAGSADGVSPAVVQRALSSWSAVVAPARMLAVVDVSGTMNGTVPTAGNATRMQVTLEAARRGLSLFNDDWAVGLWIFSTHLDGDKDYRQLAPIESLSTNRKRLVDALAQIQPKPRGDTGLYDTVLAAYQQVQADWQPGRVNSVVVLTDGIGNDDPDGISLPELTDRLAELRDDTRPVQLIVLGIGDAVNRAELTKITKVTGGGVLVAQDPATIGDVFLQAIAMRPAAG